MNEIKEEIYKILREYQDGKFKDNRSGIGALDTELSGVYLKIEELLEGKDPVIIYNSIQK